MVSDRERPGDTRRVNEAVAFIFDHQDVDGAHHKQWVLAQVVRILTDGAVKLEDEGTAP